jgi:hypothetical protein
MTKKEIEKNNKVKSLLLQLASKEVNEQVQAVKSLKVHGNAAVIKPLVEVLCNNSSQSVKDEIIDLLNTIKTTSVPTEIIKCLANDDFANARQHLLASIWNSGLDYRQYLGEIATATIKGDFMHAMECITILENIDGTLDEDQIMDALLVFKTFLVDNKSEDDSKVQLIKEIVVNLQILNDTV